MSADSRLVLVTGATGFIGRHTVAALLRRGFAVRRALSRPADLPLDEDVVVGDLAEEPDWRLALQGVHGVVHLAAVVHRLSRESRKAAEEYARVNVQASRRLARSAEAAGVRVFVHMSSIKVNGEETVPGRPFRESDTPAPQGPYAESKWAAERALNEIAGMSVAILRPPLVYGPGVGANFLSLLRAVRSGLPLPLGAVRNRRSLIYVENLAELVIRAVELEAAGTFVVADSPPISTPDLVRRAAEALGVPARLVAVPVPLLRTAGVLSGRSAPMRRLVNSLEVDAGRVRQDLRPPPAIDLADGLRATVEWFRHRVEP